MATVTVLSEREEPRRGLALAIEELGHRVAQAHAVREAVDLLAELKPQLLIVACDPGSRLAEHVLGEVDRVQPLLPVVVALERRSAARAVDLLRAGAYEVVAPPWTAENLSPTLAKALRFKGVAFEASAPMEPKKVKGSKLILAVAAVLAAAGAWRALKPAPAPPPPAPRTLAWDLPYSHPAGLAFHEGELWVTDWYSQTVYRLDPKTLATKRAIHYPKETPTALALTRDSLWIAAAGGVLVRHMLDETLTPLARVPDRLGPSLGVAYDGLYLWTVDMKTKKMHKRILDETLTEVEAYDYPGTQPAALAWDGKSLWSLDAGSRELVRHALEHPGRVTLRTTLPEYADGRFKPTGLAFDGERFWTAAERTRGAGPGRIIRHVVMGQSP